MFKRGQLFLLAAMAAGLLGSAFSDGSEAMDHPSCGEGTKVEDGVLLGTPCDDHIIAPPGVTDVKGGPGDDVIVAAPIADAASCPEGCHLGVGSQTFEGGPGNDVVYGERGNDRLFGGEGDDRLYGGIGDDLLRGGPGNDLLSGGFGADSIDGEAGDDYVRGDATQDTILDTGGGNDTLSYSTGVAPGFFENHALDPSASKGMPPQGNRGVYLDLTANEGDDGVAPTGGGIDIVEAESFETIIGTPFSDYIVGGEKGETIYGGGGADVILGNGGNDTIYGGADGDDLEGGSGTNTIDGGAGSDHCSSPENGANCESATNQGGLVLRSPARVSVGEMAPQLGVYSQLYLTGSSGDDTITATYSAAPSPQVVFTLGAGAEFDTAAADAGGCEPPSATEAVCPLSAPLDSIALSGMGGNDSLQASGFPASVGVITDGGEGNDTLTGEDASEDVLVDGPDEGGPGNDTLSGLGGDDALLNNGGVDHLFGGAGNDLFLSNSICDGDTIDGGGGEERDNASWAKFKSAVEARIGVGDAGRPGAGGAPECTTGKLDSLVGIEDLEGTSSSDVFYGGPGNNQLLGWAGSDSYFGEGGNDIILANSGDDDAAIDCGEGDDTALIDRPPFSDLVPIGCESVQEADVNNFRVETKLPPPPPPEEEPEVAAPKPEPGRPPKSPHSPLSGAAGTPSQACLPRAASRHLRCAEQPQTVDLRPLGLVSQVHWRHWGSRNAVGFGQLKVLKPCCGGGRARVRARGRTWCKGRFWYSRLAISYGRAYRRPFLHAVSQTPCG
jgi:Ca2+-binding RTX toxin-like protein